MRRDIESIIERVKQQIPEAVVKQWIRVHPADDDGIWWFYFPGVKKDIQIESWNGICPVIVESDDFSSFDAKTAHSIDEAVLMISEYLNSLKRS